MQAQRKRKIQSGNAYSSLFPESIQQDQVIQPSGKARLHHTINLIKQIVQETKDDTRSLAKYLRGKDVQETCQNIWDFVYDHIQYTRDKTGVEQVRRPARTWADRKHGVDCDCYSVFISSILTNLKVPHQLRITKYGGKPHFQHIYPIVPTQDGYLTLDCVTDQFDYEVPYSEARDFDMNSRTPVEEINGLREVSGVDSADLLEGGLGVYRLKQSRLSLRETVHQKKVETDKPAKLIIKPIVAATEPLITKASSPSPTITPSVRMQSAPTAQPATLVRTRQRPTGLWIKLLLAFGVGLGTYKFIESAN